MNSTIYMMIDLHPDAYALRPVRTLVKQNAFRYYEAITFPDDPRGGCELYLRRCKICGYLKDDGNGLVIDVLDEQGDVVQDFPITRQGFEYLRRTLRFRVAA